MHVLRWALRKPLLMTLLGTVGFVLAASNETAFIAVGVKADRTIRWCDVACRNTPLAMLTELTSREKVFAGRAVHSFLLDAVMLQPIH